MQNKYTKQLIIIDKDTGEVLQEVPMKSTECVDIVDYRKKLNDNQKKHLQDKNNLKQFNDNMGGFVFMYFNNLLYSDIGLELGTITRVIYLATYIDYDNYLMLNNNYASGNQKKYINKKDIKNIMGLSDRAFRDFMQELTKKDILIQVGDKFKINSKYFSKGKPSKNNNQFTRVYINTIRLLYKNTTPRNHKCLAYVFKLLPCVDLKTNIVCYNPNTGQELKKMYMKDIAEFLGVSTDKKNLDKFVKNNLYKIFIEYNNKKYWIINKITIENGGGRVSYFAVNPMLYYAGNDINNVNEVMMQLLNDN